jgi:hypothetical protein
MKDNLNWTELFLDVLERTGSVRAACAAARVGRSTVYRHRAASPEFTRAWRAALDLAVEAFEDELRDRVFDRSDPASARLLMFYLRCHKPEIYAERRRGAEPAFDLGRLVEEARGAAAALGYPAAPAVAAPEAVSDPK